MIEIELKIDQLNNKRYYIKGNNIIHREDGPAVEYADGTKFWFQHGKPHRLDGPAVEYADGTKYWWQNGKRHREDGAAIEYADCDYKAWYQHGKRHRLDGPAIEDANGTKLWYLDGKEIYCHSQQEFEKLLKLKAFW